MRVSFITTVRNEHETIGAYLRTLASQTRPPDEVIIVDGGSSDDTIGEIERHASLFRDIKVISRPCNIAAGRNVAVANATGDVIVMSDAGCVLRPDWAEELVRPFEVDPSVEIVSGNYVIAREGGLRDLLRWYYLRSRGDFADGVRRASMPSARSFAILRSVWLELGGHPEFLYAAEDTLFNLKWGMQNRHWRFADGAVCQWRMHSSLSAFGRQKYNYARGDGHLSSAMALGVLIFHFRAFCLYCVCLGLVALGIGLQTAAGLAMVGVGTSAGLVFLWRRKRSDWKKARDYGFGLGRSLLAVCLTLYADWKGFRGAWAGIRERASSDLDLRILAYMAASRSPRQVQEASESTST